MFVSEWKWQNGIKDGPLPSSAVLRIDSVCDENPDRKKYISFSLKRIFLVKHAMQLVPSVGIKMTRGNLEHKNSLVKKEYKNKI